jgi:hypothetical protein
LVTGSSQEASIMLCSLATKLGDEDLARIKKLEKETGLTVVAFACHPVEPAAATSDQVGAIKELEEELGMALVAVK